MIWEILLGDLGIFVEIFMMIRLFNCKKYDCVWLLKLMGLLRINKIMV